MFRQSPSTRKCVYIHWKWNIGWRPVLPSKIAQREGERLVTQLTDEFETTKHTFMHQLCHDCTFFIHAYFRTCVFYACLPTMNASYMKHAWNPHVLSWYKQNMHITCMFCYFHAWNFHSWSHLYMFHAWNARNMHEVWMKEMFVHKMCCNMHVSGATFWVGMILP